MDLIRKVSSEALVMAMVLAIFWPQLSAGQKVKIKPTTTLQEQLSNNTSAADRFRNSSNGNMGSTHVSKVNVHSLLYSGATTRVYAHLMPWWGDPRHIDAGYNSHDPEQIRRVVINLIDNAIEAMEQRGTIEIETQHDRSNNLVRIVVADDGPGIPASERDKLFLPYYSTKKRGSGLGLAIVRRIIAEHGGSIDLTDNAPRGTRFAVELPC